MYYWTNISSDATEAYEFFIRIGTRGVVLRPKGQDRYTTYVELDEEEQHWSDQPFSHLYEAKAWCEEQLKQTSAPAAGVYIFARLPERDTEDELCFMRVSKAFTRQADAVRWYESAEYTLDKIRLYLMLERIPERFYEPREVAGNLRFEF